MRFTTVAAVLLSAFFICKADRSDWHKKITEHRDACVKELNLSNDTIKSFKEIMHMNSLDEFSENDRCLLKCVVEKEIGQTTADIEKFMDTWVEFLGQKIGMKVPPSLKSEFKDSLDTCKALRGENDCDAVVLFDLCKKEIFKKLHMNKHH